MFWISQDSLFLSALLTSLSSDVTRLVAAAKTSFAVWTKLATAFASPRSCPFRLRKRLLKPQGSDSVIEYLHDIHNTTDEFALLSKPIDDDELTVYIINGLSPTLNDISTVVHS